MNYQAVLIDIDDTLFDFRQSSFTAMQRAFSDWGYDFTTADVAQYERYNDDLWKRFERGEVTKEFLFVERFRLYFEERAIFDISPADFNARYLAYLAEGYAFMPHCRELLEALHGRYKVYVVTNGDTYAQNSRIARSGMAHLFDGVFISEQMGCKKPEKQFFDGVFAAIGEEYRTCSLIVGDSLTSDMQGGRNAGIPTCFYGDAAQADARCDYVIDDLMQLLDVLDGTREAQDGSPLAEKIKTDAKANCR